MKVVLVDAGTRTPATLGRKLGGGAIGDIFDVTGQPALVVKLYVDFNTRRVDPALAAAQRPRIEAMLQRTPKIGSPVRDAQGNAYPQLAWPTHQVLDANGRFVGYAMPKLPLHLASDLETVLLPRSRASSGLPQDWIFRLYVARNLAALLRELHREGHHVIDMKPKNMSIYKNAQNPGLLALLDADGFSIQAGDGTRFAGTHYTPEYISPELQGRSPALGDELHDRWALAVIIFRLLNENIHPYQGRYAGQDSPTLDDHVRADRYAYGRVPNRQLAPMVASMHEYFDPDTRTLFDRAFGPTPAARPSAREWREHLDLFVAAGQTRLLRCRRDPDHWHFAGGCGLCFREDLMRGRRPTPPSATAGSNTAPAPVTPPAPAPTIVVAAPPPARPAPSRPARATPHAPAPVPTPGPQGRSPMRARVLQWAAAAAVGAIAVSWFRDDDRRENVPAPAVATAPPAAVASPPPVPAPPPPAVTRVETPTPAGLVTDLASALSADESAYLASRLELFAKAGWTMKVLTVPTTGSESIDAFGRRVANDWGAAGEAARSDILVTLSTRERRIRVDVSRQLQPQLDDAELVQLLQKAFQPAARQGGPGQGLGALVDAIDRALATRRLAATTDAERRTLTLDAADAIASGLASWDGVAANLAPQARAVLDASIAALESMPRPARGERKAARALHASGLTLLRQDDFAALAVEKLRAAHAADPLDVQIVNDLAFAQHRAGMHQDAVENLLKTLRLAPRRTSAWVNLAELLPALGAAGEEAEKTMADAYVVGYWFSQDRDRTLSFLRERHGGTGTEPQTRAAAGRALRKLNALEPPASVARVGDGP